MTNGNRHTTADLRFVDLHCDTIFLTKRDEILPGEHWHDPAAIGLQKRAIGSIQFEGSLFRLRIRSQAERPHGDPVCDPGIPGSESVSLPAV